MKISLQKYAEALAASLKNEKDSQKIQLKINNLLKILAKRKQSRLIRRLYEIFRKIWLNKQGKIEIIATVPYETSKDQLSHLSKLIEKVLKKDISITTKIDPEIIGGMKLEFDDYVIDATLITTLKNLKTHLITH